MKAVTDTKYYHEIAEKLFLRGAYLPALTPADMVEAVEEVAVFQYRDGYADGETNGRQAQRQEWWTRVLTDFEGNYAFYGNNWDDTIYDPPTDIGLVITSTTKTFQNTFYNADLHNTLIPIDARGCNLTGTFRYSTIQTIPLLIIDEETVFNDRNVFSTAQKSITLQGTLASNLDLSLTSVLDKTSVDSIIGALKDFVGEGSSETRTLTLHSTVNGNMTDAQRAEITTKGWTLA